MTYATSKLGPSLFLLPSKRIEAKGKEEISSQRIWPQTIKYGSNGNGSRWILFLEDEKECTSRKRNNLCPVIWGGMEEIIELLKKEWQRNKDRNFSQIRIRCCDNCRDSCRYPLTSVAFQIIPFSTQTTTTTTHTRWSPPEVWISLTTCKGHGSYSEITYPVIALSGKAWDVFELLNRADFGRLSLNGSPKNILGTDFKPRQEKEEPPTDTKHLCLYESQNSKENSMELFDYACANLRVIEFGNNFKLYQSVAKFLHRVLAPDKNIDNDGKASNSNPKGANYRSTIKYLNLTSCLSEGVQAEEFQDAVDVLADALKHNKSLEFINLRNCKLDDADVAKLLDGMKYNPNLKRLDLSGNECREESMKALGRLLSSTDGCPLEYLNMSYLRRGHGNSTRSNSSSDVLDFASLANPGLTVNRALEELRLVETPTLKESGVEAILNADRTSTEAEAALPLSTKNGTKSILGLQRLYIHDMLEPLTPVTSALLVQLRGLRSICLSSCELSGEALGAIGDAFMKQHHSKHSITIERLDLRNNDFSECSAGDMERFSQGISSCTLLRRLNLEGNRLDDDHIVILARCLPTMKSLISLNLDMNSFDVVGATSLVEGLKENKVLRALKVATDCECFSFYNRFYQSKSVKRFLPEYDQMKYYTALNRGGRILLEKGDTVPFGLWALIIEKICADGPLFAIPAEDVIRIEDWSDEESDRDNVTKQKNFVREYFHDVIFCLLRGQVLIR